MLRFSAVRLTGTRVLQCLPVFKSMIFLQHQSPIEVLSNLVMHRQMLTGRIWLGLIKSEFSLNRNDLIRLLNPVSLFSLSAQFLMYIGQLSFNRVLLGALSYCHHLSPL